MHLRRYVSLTPHDFIFVNSSVCCCFHKFSSQPVLLISIIHANPHPTGLNWDAMKIGANPFASAVQNRIDLKVKRNRIMCISV